MEFAENDVITQVCGVYNLSFHVGASKRLDIRYIGGDKVLHSFELRAKLNIRNFVPLMGPTGSKRLVLMVNTQKQHAEWSDSRFDKLIFVDLKAKLMKLVAIDQLKTPMRWLKFAS